MAMDRAVARHLARRGVLPTPPQGKTVAEKQRDANFFRWFDECVMGFDPEEYRREFWREFYKTGHTIGHVPYGLSQYRRSSPLQVRGSILFFLAALACSIPLWFIRRAIDRHIARLRRPTYYETERQRRHELAEERRRVRRRRTISPMPSMDDIREALTLAPGSPVEMVRLGSLVEDLECYVDNSIYFNENGELAGRRGGIRRHLQEHAPDLYARYKTLMRYKSLARKFRQAAGEADPIPAAALLPPREFNSDRNLAMYGIVGAGNDDEPARTGIGGAKRRMGGTSPRDKVAVGTIKPGAEAMKAARELLSDCETSYMSLAAQLALRLCPDYTPAIDPETLRNGIDSPKTTVAFIRHGRNAPASAMDENRPARTG